MTILFSKTTNGFYDNSIHNDSQIPIDAVEITSEHHHYLLDGQGEGKKISFDEVGFPILTDSPLPTLDELATAARANRDKLLAETDWTQYRDVPTETSKKFLKYRQELRDTPTQMGFPEQIIWPTKPQHTTGGKDE